MSTKDYSKEEAVEQLRAFLEIQKRFDRKSFSRLSTEERRRILVSQCIRGSAFLLEHEQFLKKLEVFNEAVKEVIA